MEPILGPLIDLGIFSDYPFELTKLTIVSR